MKGLIPGENALVIGARTNHGKKHLVGKTVLLVQRMAIVDADDDGVWRGSCVIFPETTYNLNLSGKNLWLIRKDGYHNPMVLVDLPEGYAFVAEENLLPIQPDDGLIEEFKRESDKLLEKV